MFRNSRRMLACHNEIFEDEGSNKDSSLYTSQQKVNKRQQQREPKTREEAQRQWKELQNTPDHLGLLKVYKRAGVEPIKLAKYVFVIPSFTPGIYRKNRLTLWFQQRKRHHPRHRPTPTRPQNPRSPRRPPHPPQRPRRPPQAPSPHTRIRRAHLRPPTPHLQYPQPAPLLRLRRARCILYGSLRARSHPATTHNRALGSPAIEFHLQEESREL